MCSLSEEQVEMNSSLAIEQKYKQSLCESIVSFYNKVVITSVNFFFKIHFSKLLNLVEIEC